MLLLVDKKINFQWYVQIKTNKNLLPIGFVMKLLQKYCECSTF